MSRGGVIAGPNPQAPGAEAGRIVSGANQETRYPMRYRWQPISYNCTSLGFEVIGRRLVWRRGWKGR